MKQEFYSERASLKLWSIDEMRKIRELAHQTNHEGALLAVFPGRSIKAIRRKLSIERRRLGIQKLQRSGEAREREHFAMLAPDDPGCRDEEWGKWQRRARRGSEQYLAALMGLVA